MDNVKTLLKKYFHLIIGKTKEVREDGNALIFLVFLVLATCFWILNALQKDNYITEVRYPVSFINDSKSELVTGAIERNLELKIRGGGFKVLPYHLKQQFESEPIELSNLRRVTIDGVTGAYLNSVEYFKLIEDQLAIGIELVSVSPDTLFIPLMEKISKRVPVIVDAQVSFDQQCQFSGDITVQPDSIIVSGPQNIIDTISFVRTKPQNYEEVADTLVRNIQLVSSDLVDLEQNRVVITIPVEPFTEAFSLVSVKAVNLPDSLVFKSFPPEIEVSYHIGLSRPLYRSSQFNATVDFSTVDLNNLPTRLKLWMSDFPKDIHNMNYSPLFVEYLLEKKE